MSIKRLVPLNTVSLTADPSNAVAGDIYYNSGSSQLRYFNGTSWVILAGSVNALVDAKSIYQDVRNQSGTNMALATPVYVSGGIGASNKILISTASNASEASSSKTMGITTSAISNNSNGQVISEGLLEGIDTTGAADGDPVWLGVDGAKIYGLLNKPSAPAHLVFLGIVIRGGSSNTGSMYVKIQNGFELQEIHNVELSSLINGNILAYDSTTSTWKNTNTLQSTASTVPLVIKGSASQSTNLQEWQNNSATVLARVSNTGIFVGGAFSSDGSQAAGTNIASQFGSTSATRIPLVVYGAPSQSANLQEWQANGGTSLAWFTSNGTLNVRYARATTNDSTIIPLIAKGAASQTADLQQWQNSAGTILLGVTAGGGIYNPSNTSAASFGMQSNAGTPQGAYFQVFGNNYSTSTQRGGAEFVFSSENSGTGGFTAFQYQSGAWTPRFKVFNGGFTSINSTSATLGGGSVSSQLGVVINGATTVGSVIRGAASQSADLGQWQNSTGDVLLGIDSTGSLNIGAGSSNVWKIKNQTSTVMEWQPAQGFMFLPYGASNRPVTIKGAASQTANLTEWHNSDGVVLSSVGPNGTINIKSVGGSNIATFYNGTNGYGAGAITSGGTFNINGANMGFPYTASGATLSVNAQAANQLGMTVRGYASQTYNLQEWQNSAGTALVNISSSGVLNTNANINLIGVSAGGLNRTIDYGNSYGAAALYLYNAGANARWGWGLNAGEMQFFATNDSATNHFSWNRGGDLQAVGTNEIMRLTVGTGATSTLNLNTGGTTATGLVIKGVASQTANLTEWQDSTGAVLASIWASGTFVTSGRIAVGNGSTGAKLDIMPASSTQLGVTIKANASQTANLLEFQNSSGTALTYFNPSGGLTATEGVISTLYSGGKMTTGTLGYLNATTFNAAVSPVVVRGAASQSANLQEWQDNTGTALASISASGGFTIPSLTVSGDFIVNGTTTNINTTNLVVEDKNITIADVTTPTDTTADGAGITIKGATDKTLNWVQSTGSFTSSEPLIVSSNAANNITVFTAKDANNNKVIVNSDASNRTFITAQSNSSATGQAGAYFTADGFEESWFNINTRSNTAGQKYMRFGNLGNKFLVQRLNDAANVITSTPFTIENTSTTNSLYINSTGTIINGATALGQLTVYPASASTIGMVIRSAASQTANLQEWHDSSGNVLAGANNTSTALGLGVGAATSGFFIINGAYGGFGNAEWVVRRDGGNLLIQSPAGNLMTSTYDAVVVAVKGKSEQTANLQEWQNASGTVLAKVEATGGAQFLGLNVQGTGSGIVNIGTAAVGNVGLIIKSVASQTADLTQWQNSAGQTLVNIGPNSAAFNGGAAASVLYPVGINAQPSVDKLLTVGTTGWSSFNSATVVHGIYTRQVNAGTGDIVGIYSQPVANNATGHAAATSIASAIRSAGGASSVINSGYNFYANSPTISSGTITSLYGLYINTQKITGVTNAYGVYQAGVDDLNYLAGRTTIQSGGTGYVPLIAKGIASQTANLTEWQNSAGTVLAAINSGGAMRSGTFASLTNGLTIIVTNLDTNGIGITPQSAAQKGLIIRGAASQTANLQEWQNNSATVLAKVDANGNFSAISKSFDIPHPTKESMRLRYASLEGNEHGVYVRGTTKEKFIELPEYWTELVDESTITVSLTSVGKFQKVYVEKIEGNKIYIGGRVKEISYAVFGERKDIDKLIVEY